jgi:hypothetical protein
MNPYIKFVNYPQNYNWILELIWPQPSPFVETTNNNIYKTWNGDVLINFKWDTYGKYYFALIWIVFMVLYGCFSAAAMISQQYIDENTRKQLLISTFILGLIHLTFEVRQLFNNPIKYLNFWDMLGIYIYCLF